MQVMIENYSTIVSVNLEDGKMVVVRRYPSNSMFACDPPRPVPDQIVKEIYAAQEDGTIALEETMEGKHTPAYNVNEAIEFE